MIGGGVCLGACRLFAFCASFDTCIIHILSTNVYWQNKQN
nr:MAG TPA: hypothetical protein [Caudoviricetes sp.]